MSSPIYPNYQLNFGLPRRLDDWIPQDHPVRFLCDVVDALDLEEMGFLEPRISPKGRPFFSANLMVKAWLFGFMEHFRSTRRLEWACRNVVSAMWLTGYEKPDHNTLSRFFRENLKPLRQLFKAVTRLAAGAGLVGMVLHALDGTKIQAACSSRTAQYRGSLEKDLERLDAVIDDFQKHVEAEPLPGESGGRLPEALRNAQTRRTEIQRGLAGLRREGTNHLHPDEPDARMMLVRKTTEMGYNAQAVVDHENGLIVQADVVNDANDSKQLEPQLLEVRETLGATADETAVDTSYANGEQVDRVQDLGIGVLIPQARLEPEPLAVDPSRELPKPVGPYDKARFSYDAVQDAYRCPRGQLLPLSAQTNKNRPGDPVTVFRCTQKDCPVRQDCSQDPAGRTIHRKTTDAALDWQREKQRDPEMQARLKLRKVIVEPVFGIIKWNRGFWRFTVRGLQKVGAQWALMCTAFNLRKLYTFWRKGWLRLAAAAAA